MADSLAQICKCGTPDLDCPGFMVCQTRRQVHSNYMLFMRRTMKGIAQIMRVDRFLLWMDSDNGEPEPHLEKDDTIDYLLAAGHTREGIQKGLDDLLEVIDEAKKRAIIDD